MEQQVQAERDEAVDERRFDGDFQARFARHQDENRVVRDRLAGHD